MGNNGIHLLKSQWPLKFIEDEYELNSIVNLLARTFSIVTLLTAFAVDKLQIHLKFSTRASLWVRCLIAMACLLEFNISNR